METFVTFVHVLVALFMILVVLVQGGNQGGVGAAFGGGGGSGSVMGATGGQSLLGKLTYGAAFVFMTTSVILTASKADQTTDLKERLEQRVNAGTAETLAPDVKDEENAVDVDVEAKTIEAEPASENGEEAQP